MLLGASGSGKGSVGAALLERGVIAAHASMGAWLREILRHPATLEPDLAALQPEGFASPLEYLLHCVTNGLLIPDAWTQAVIERHLHTRSEQAPNGLWALDGYPRTVGAARHLIEALERTATPLLGAVHLCVSDSVAMQRLLTRGRADDSTTAILERLEFYRHSVVPTLDWLKTQGVAVVEISGEDCLALVVEAVEGALERWKL